MTGSTRDFLEVARERGFVHQVTDADALAARLRGGVVSGYIGFDCTADSLHVGSLMQIMLLRLLQSCGHRPVVLMGGGTTKVGDPSFRDDARPLLDDARIEANKAGIRRAFEPFLRFGEGPADAIMLDNAEWLDELRYIPFLREIGRHFSVNRMLTMDSVKLRLDRDQPLSFLEFNYMLLQSYDFAELHRRHGVVLQMGGSDQWGNIVMGADLVRRVRAAERQGPDDAAEAFGLTTPLLATASGAKMGKTAAGAVWLNADRVSAYEYWQFWRNTEDADVGRFLALFTELPMDKVRSLGALPGAEINVAKIALATEATALLHGRAAADEAALSAQAVFRSETVTATDSAVASVVRTALPTIAAVLPASVVDLLALAGLVASKSEARRKIDQRGVRLNDAPVTDPLLAVMETDLRDGAAKLSLGRKRHVLVRPGGAGNG